MALTTKQKTFIDHIARGCSHSEAYRRAYASEGTPQTVATEAYRLVQKPEIAAAIQWLRDRMTLARLRMQLHAVNRMRECGDI